MIENNKNFKLGNCTEKETIEGSRGGNKENNQSDRQEKEKGL